MAGFPVTRLPRRSLTPAACHCAGAALRSVRPLTRPRGLAHAGGPLWVNSDGSAIGRERQLHPSKLTVQRMHKSFDQCQLRTSRRSAGAPDRGGYKRAVVRYQGFPIHSCSSASGTGAVLLLRLAGRPSRPHRAEVLAGSTMMPFRHPRNGPEIGRSDLTIVKGTLLLCLICWQS
jgi:hypothetical protein